MTSQTRRKVKISSAIISMIVVFVLVPVSGCAKGEDGPRDVLSKYLDDALYGREDRASVYLEEDNSVDEQSSVPQEKDKSRFREVLYSKIAYNIDEIEEKNGTARARVTVSAPDFGTVFMDIHAAAYGSLYQDTISEDEMDGILADRYSGGDIPLTYTIRYFDMKKGKKGWKVLKGDR